ncbi:MAG: hypothetical protein QT02_C0003G0021 [archaeon GW2011_AR9]|nr:MAG: hypothetical protein QT02_C0003G0021 [archaeon GW2011_AR9]
MISARLMKSLEQEGFILDFPGYAFNEEKIIEILQQNNERLLLALPLLLQYPFDYLKISKQLRKGSLAKFKKIIIITSEICKRKKINNLLLKNILKQYSLHQKIPKGDMEYYYTSFKESLRNQEKKEESGLIAQISIRGILNLNQALARIYSPGKLRIMNKIFNHEKLTNTELKYYYRAIRPLILSILNENMQKYLRLIESAKKYIQEQK